MACRAHSRRPSRHTDSPGALRTGPSALAAQHVRSTNAARVADAVEELENLDRALAPEAQRIAEARRVHRTMLAMTGAEDRRELRDCSAVVVQIAHHLVHIALAHELAQYGAHSLLGFVHAGGQIAHPGRIEAPGE